MADHIRMIISKDEDNYYIEYESSEKVGPIPDCPPWCKATYTFDKVRGVYVTTERDANIQEIKVRD